MTEEAVVVPVMRLERYAWPGPNGERAGNSKSTLHGKYSTRLTKRLHKKAQYRCLRCGDIFSSDDRRPRCENCGHGKVKKAPLGTVERKP